MPALPAKRSGQAAVEFLVGLLLLLILITSMIHVANMGRASLYLHAVLRGDAGEDAMRGGTLGTSPKHISDWTPGPDRLRYTADDQPKTGGSPLGTLALLSGYSEKSPGDWLLVAKDSQRPPSLNLLGGGPADVITFSRKEGDVYVQISPIIQQLVYGKKEVRIHEEVWMPLMGGLY
ncbi:MAG: hypothetical protein LBW77_05600 [Verrucomicrobiota bacterium]|jgi:hypothetical protein|nr:hypothetical protein [Verrucomicrobiota bacterium]